MSKKRENSEEPEITINYQVDQDIDVTIIGSSAEEVLGELKKIKEGLK